MTCVHIRIYQQKKIIKKLAGSYVMDSVSKLIMDDINESLFRAERIVFQSDVSVPSNNKQIDSSANLTTAGGLAIDLISDNCFFLMPLTAKKHYFRCHKNKK